MYISPFYDRFMAGAVEITSRVFEIFFCIRLAENTRYPPHDLQSNVPVVCAGFIFKVFFSLKLLSILTGSNV